MANRFASLIGARGKDLVVASALIWAVLIVAVTGTLQATPDVDHLLPVLVAASLGSVVIVAAGVKSIHG